jgi:ubiquinone/menaquinone biosynthesis C-methylase UbiE
MDENRRAWEDAYRRFSTSEQEIRKFTRRLRKLGALEWPRQARIVELFCGRGNGLHALTRLGFTRLVGVDRSVSLLASYRGPATCYVSDCRQLPLADGSMDVVIIQGGLHHLPVLPDSLVQTLTEVQRILRSGGRCVIVEPWLTPFLSCVHWLSRRPLAQRLSRRVAAFAEMTHHEQHTYDQWLAQADVILALLRCYLRPERCMIGWGKLMFVGVKESNAAERYRW